MTRERPVRCVSAGKGRRNCCYTLCDVRERIQVCLQKPALRDAPNMGGPS
jgi:hypothetical protein